MYKYILTCVYLFFKNYISWIAFLRNIERNPHLSLDFHCFFFLYRLPQVKIEYSQEPRLNWSSQKKMQCGCSSECLLRDVRPDLKSVYTVTTTHNPPVTCRLHYALCCVVSFEFVEWWTPLKCVVKWLTSV